MYKGFNLILKDSDITNFNNTDHVYTSQDKRTEMMDIRENMKENALNKIENFLNKDGSIDATALINEWFPTIKADVFISHSHKDEELAIKFAAWLKNVFNLNSFIDSTVWGYADDLLKEIDMNHCYNSGSNSYDYNKRNFSTSHVHLMLSSALNTMIDNTECLFFLNTPNSINIDDTISQKTFSPWIFSEIMTSSIVRKHNPRKIVIKNNDGYFQKTEERSLPTIAYDAQLGHLHRLELTDLKNWSDKYNTTKRIDKMVDNMVGRTIVHPLDMLYFDSQGLGTLYGR